MSSTRSLIAVVAITASMAGAAQAQAYVNIDVGGAFVPGVYGQISIGNNVPPPLMDAQPVVVGRANYGAAPIYLHVSIDEYRDWGRYCNRYRACNEPVYFIRVDQNNRWWERNNDYLRGPNQYRRDDVPRYEQRRDRRDGYDRNDRNDRNGRNGQYDPRNPNQLPDYKNDPRYRDDPRFEAQRGER